MGCGVHPYGVRDEASGVQPHICRVAAVLLWSRNDVFGGSARSVGICVSIYCALNLCCNL